jgi:Tol biopolymer transport system component
MWGCYNQYSHPQWSPTQPTLAFACGFDVYIYDLPADALSNLTSLVTRLHTDHNFPEWWPRDFYPAWSATGDSLLFLSDRDEDLGQKGSDFIANAMFSMNPDGTDPVRITQQSDQMILGYTWIFRPPPTP